MTVRSQVVEALARINLGVPASGEAYVGRGWKGAPHGWDLPERLEVLLAAGYQFRALLVGTVGVGKTTELERWEEVLADRVEVIRVALPTVENWQNELEGAVWSALGQHRVVRNRPRSGADVWRDIERGTGRRVLVLVDGLDRLTQDEARRAFGPGTRLCAPHLPAIVYTASHYVLLWNLSDRDDRFEQVWHLPPFPVLTRAGQADEGTVEHLKRGLQRRLTGTNVLEHTKLLYRVVLASGGVPRNALRILRGALLSAASKGRVNASHLLEGEREVRQDLEQPLVPGDRDVLIRAFESGEFSGDPRLVTSGAILPYEGEEGRYWLPNPLLWHLLPEGILPARRRVAFLNAWS